MSPRARRSEGRCARLRAGLGRVLRGDRANDLVLLGVVLELNPESETGLAVTSHLIHFPAVDSLFVVLSLSSGRHLWNGGE